MIGRNNNKKPITSVTRCSQDVPQLDVLPHSLMNDLVLAG